MRLEQVIMDASKEWCVTAGLSGGLSVEPEEAAAIAEAVRGWMNEVAREPGHGPAGGVQDIQATRIKELEDECKRMKQKAEDWDALMETREVHPQKQVNESFHPDDLEALKEFFGGRPVSTGISPVEGDDLQAMLKLHLDNQRGLTREESERLTKLMHETATEGPAVEENKRIKLPPWDDLVAEAACVTTMWEEKVDEYPECKELLDLVGKLSTGLNQSQADIARMEEEFRTADYDLAEKVASKATKYDELRAKFLFLPGEEFWTLFQNSVTKWTIEKVWFNNDGRQSLTGYRKRQNGSILESPTYKASECHHTADACKAAILVEE